MIDYIKNLDDKINLSFVKNLKKKELCHLYEYILRNSKENFLRPLYFNFLKKKL